MNVLMATPTTRDFSVNYVRSLFTTQFRGKLGWFPLYGQSIDVGRNMICKTFLHKYRDFDYLLMHDSDASWNPQAVQRLADRGLPVVTGVIFKRSVPTVPTIGKYLGVSVDGKHMYSFADTVNDLVQIAERFGFDESISNDMLLDTFDGDLKEIDGCGAHFMMIRRDVLEAFGTEKNNWFEATTVNGGEDFDFCRKVKQAGYSIYVDYTVFTGHHLGGTMELGIREFLTMRQTNRVETLWIA